jgi:hypothetical protein
MGGEVCMGFTNVSEIAAAKQELHNINGREGRIWFCSGVLLVVIVLTAHFGLITGRQGLEWDNEAYFTPAFTMVADHALAGRLVLWNPWESGGTPEYAEPELGTTSPITLVIGAISRGSEAGFRAYWVFIWILTALGMLTLARYLRAPLWAGLVVAVGFTFSGFYTGQAEHTCWLYSMSFLPWMLWRLDVALTEQRVRAAAETGALWGLSALGGYPGLTILSAGFLFLWALARYVSARWGEEPTLHQSQDRLRLGFAGKIFVVVFAVGIPVLAPPYVAFFSEGRGYSDRVGVRSREEAITSNRMEAGALATFSSPYLTDLKLYGNPRLWPTSDGTLTNAYLGALTLILAALAIVNRPTSVWRWSLLAMGAFFLACAVGKQLPIRGWLYDYCPPTRYFRNAAMFRAYAMLCAALVAIEAGKDLQRAINNNNAGSGLWKRLTFIALVIAIAAILAFHHVISSVDHVGPWLHRAHRHLAWVWLGSVLLSIVFLLLPRSRKALPLLLVLLAIVDASLTIRLTRPMIVSDHARQVWDRLNAEHKRTLDLGEKGLNRLPRPAAWIGGHVNNDNIPLRVPTFFNYAVMTNRFQMDFANHPVLVDMSTGNNRIWFSSQAATVPPTDIFYQAFVKRTEVLHAPVLLLHSRANMDKIREHDAVTASDTAGVLKVSELPAAQKISVVVQRYTPNHLDFTISCPQDGWLMVTDRWSQGWQARVNQQRAEVLGGDFIFRAVLVKAGVNAVEFSYRPAGWPWLVFLSWGVLGTVFLVPLSWWRGIPIVLRRA